MIVHIEREISTAEARKNETEQVKDTLSKTHFQRPTKHTFKTHEAHFQRPARHSFRRRAICARHTDHTHTPYLLTYTLSKTHFQRHTFKDVRYARDTLIIHTHTIY